MLNGEVFEDKRFLRSLMYGEGVFETFRYNKKLPKYIDYHFERLLKGAELFKIPKITKEDFIYYIEKSVKEHGGNDLYVKTILVSEGNSYFPLIPERSNLFVIVKDFKPLEKKEITLIKSPFNIHSSSPLRRIKSINYGENIVAKRYALENQADDVILLNEHNQITETTTSNIFWLKGKYLYTASLDCGVLDGITRKVIIEEGKKEGFTVVEGRFYISDLKKADYVFVTNALHGIVKVKEIKEKG